MVTLAGNVQSAGICFACAGPTDSGVPGVNIVKPISSGHVGYIIVRPAVIKPLLEEYLRMFIDTRII